MGWLLSRQPVNQSRIDDTFQAVGRSTYVAAMFDRDVASLVTWLELPAVWSDFSTWSPEQIIEFQEGIGRRLLHKRLTYATRELRADSDEVLLLAEARQARNSIFHEMPHIPLHASRFGIGSTATSTEHSTQILAAAMNDIRSQVYRLTPGCALVGAWLFQLVEQDDDQLFPRAFFDVYADQLAWWILAPVWDLLPRIDREPDVPRTNGSITPDA